MASQTSPKTWSARKIAVLLVSLDELAARYLARHAQDLYTSRPVHPTRQNLSHDHLDFLESDDARYARETMHQFNMTDPPVPPASPKASDTPSVCSSSGHPYVTPPEVVDIDEVDQEILWNQLPELRLTPRRRRRIPPISTEFVPNSGISAVSLLRIFSGTWWSLPTSLTACKPCGLTHVRPLPRYSPPNLFPAKLTRRGLLAAQGAHLLPLRPQIYSRPLCPVRRLLPVLALVFNSHLRRHHRR